MVDLTVYAEKNFGGEYFGFGPGSYSISDLQYAHNYNFNDSISSIRVAANTVAELFNHGLTSGDASDSSRVIIGPAEIADLSTIGFDNVISTIRVRKIVRENSYNSAYGAVTISGGIQLMGLNATLPQGKYDSSRLSSLEANKIGDNKIRSIHVDDFTLAILYDKDNFDNSGNAIAIIGPKTINDLSSIGFFDKISSLEIISLERPVSNSSNIPEPNDQLKSALESRSRLLQEPLIRPLSNNLVYNGKKAEPPIIIVQQTPNYMIMLILMLIFIIIITLTYLVASNNRQPIVNIDAI